MAIEQQLEEFISWWRNNIKGDEKGEAQIFVDRLMKAFGHEGAIETGGIFEERIRKKRNGKTTVSFADYHLPKTVLIEMKKRGEDLKKHYKQLEAYWFHLPIKPTYAILCNFDEILIYDFYTQLYDPVDTIQITEIVERRSALEFLRPNSINSPTFKNNMIEVTKDAAFQLGQLFQSLRREVGQDIAQRFTLQSMIAMFAEDVGLLPDATLPRIISLSREAEPKSESDNSHDLMAMLFTMMNYPGNKRTGGRFYNVPYFNGGLFSTIHPIALSKTELSMMSIASNQNWARIRPSIFGTMFEDSMESQERHKIGAHFTSELDIKRIVDPVIVEPWNDLIDSVNVLDDAMVLYEKLCRYIVLDPACGSGNFLYIAYREMKTLEAELRERIIELGGDANQLIQRVTAKQFYGYDINPFAVELAKVSLMIAKKLAVDEFESDEHPLPLDNLDANIKNEDALFNEWVEFDACIGNPPYLGIRRFQEEHGLEAANRIYEAFPDVPHVADYCVYWFRKAHDAMKLNARAGLVGTNSITRTNGRIASLDYIIVNGGVIYDAIQSMPWSGEANVDVSIVNWTKGEPPLSPQRLHLYRGQNEDGEYIFEQFNLPVINSSLSELTDVSNAERLSINRTPKRVFQGQTTGYNHGFVLSVDKAHDFIQQDVKNQDVIFPFLRGDDMLSNPQGSSQDYVIDFQQYNILEARAYTSVFSHVEKLVLPFRQAKADEEIRKNQDALKQNPNTRIKRDYQNALNQWWLHHRSRSDLSESIETYNFKRYIIASRTSLYQVFEFVSPDIVISDGIQAFIFEDDYSFGILQSRLHWVWWKVKGSSRGTLNPRATYVPNIFETFPFPQQPSAKQIKAVADAGRAIYEYRNDSMSKRDDLSLREMYRLMEDLPGKYKLRGLHEVLDKAVLDAYGFSEKDDILAQLLALNHDVATKIKAEEVVTAPGIPADYPNPDELISDGCIQPPELL